MFAIYQLSQIDHYHCCLVSVIGLIVWSWFTLP